jgi:osmotically-inducible protein OsmY
MADGRYDYYRSEDERDDDVYLDNRTGVGAPRGRGYRAHWSRDHGPTRAYGEDDSREHYRSQGYSSYGARQESHSFRPEDYRASQGGGGRYSSDSARDYQTGAYRSEPETYRAYRGHSRAESSRPRPYDSYADGRAQSSYDGDSNFGRDPGYPRHLAQDHEAHHRNFWDRAGDTVATWLGDDEARRRHEADQRVSHRGKGPKGYKRSDDRIRDDLNERLTDDLWLDASNIDVSVKDGEITLSGLVGSKDDRRYAERIADSVSGSAHVQNNLRVDANAGRDASSANAQSEILSRQAAGKH